MKAIKNVCQVLALICAVGALVLFFTNFATITSAEGVSDAIGAQLAFGSSVSVDGTAYDMAKSTDLLVCFILAAISAVSAALSFKFRKGAVVSVAFSAAGGIYMLVAALSAPNKYVDTRPLTYVTDIKYGPSVLICAIALIAAALLAVAFIFARNRIEVLESDGKKKTIIQKIVQFFRDYKSEIKKIVWPGPKTVVRNTVVVLVVCLVIGAFIWLLDFGLAKLLDLILGI